MAPAVPAALAAQQPTGAQPVPQTHTVVKGETLWGLAARYLGSGFKWPSIYDLNREAIANPHWIYPGQVLRMPGAVTSVAVTVAPPAAPAKPAAAPPPDTTQHPAPEPTLNPATGKTVFPPEYSTASNVPEVSAEKPPVFPTVLIGEYLSAPYVLKSARISGAGHLMGSGSLDAEGHIEGTTIFKAFDNVLIAPPSGAPARKGEQYVALRPGPVLFRVGQVMIPTGIVEVTHDRTGTEAVRAQVIALYGEMSPDQLLVPVDTTGIYTTARPKPVSNGRWAEVKYILSEPVLPTTSAFVVLNLTASDGVKPGDEFQLFRNAEPNRDPSALSTPAIPIGKAKVVRVTPYGATAIVTAQQQPAIDVGISARITAKMP